MSLSKAEAKARALSTVAEAARLKNKIDLIDLQITAESRRGRFEVSEVFSAYERDLIKPVADEFKSRGFSVNPTPEGIKVSWNE